MLKHILLVCAVLVACSTVTGPTAAPKVDAAPIVEKVVTDSTREEFVTAGPVKPLSDEDNIMLTRMVVELAYYLPSPTYKTIKVERVIFKKTSVAGLTYLKPAEKTIIILLDHRLSGLSLGDTLVHEWAHALSWGLESSAAPHGPIWGVLYARCYCVAYRTF